VTSIGSRHGSDLGGQLVPGRPCTVAVCLPDSMTVAEQHTAWMLINLLTRLDGVAEQIILVGSPGAISERVSPHVAEGTPFTEAAIQLSAQIGGPAVLVDRQGFDGAGFTMYVGHGSVPPEGLRVAGNGWIGTVSAGGIVLPRQASSLPFGPYVAACLATAELFRAVRMPPHRYAPVTHLEVDVWDPFGGAGTPPLDVDGVHVDFGLAGVGAVGVAGLHVLWACHGLIGTGVIADNDLKGVDLSNLNRYVLFDRRHLGLQKAIAAAAIYGSGQLAIQPIQGSYNLEHLGERSPAVLLSAVDTNESRHDLQRSLAPGVAYGASTEGLRAELLICGPPGEGPCLACHNKLIPGLPDDARRAEVLAMDAVSLARLAASLGTSSKSLLEWGRTGNCGAVSAEALGHLLADDDPAPVWSVGFVSVFAGVMLAAQLIKDTLGHTVPGEATSTKFQFMQPQAAANGRPRPQLRDPACPVCSIDVHQMVWLAHRN
jgi:hypothetical protein